MSDFDYKKYSLEHLENWLHDAMSAGEATPQEIYDLIKKVVQEQYYYYKDGASKTYELLALLNGNGKGHIQAYDDYIYSDSKGNDLGDVDGLYMTQSPLFCDPDDSSEQCKDAWGHFWTENQSDSNYDEMIAKGYEMTADGFWIPPQSPLSQKDKVVKWQLPVEVDGPSGEYFVTFPDDLLEAANLKEGDAVEWVDNNDGTYTLRKANGTK